MQYITYVKSRILTHRPKQGNTSLRTWMTPCFVCYAAFCGVIRLFVSSPRKKASRYPISPVWSAFLSCSYCRSLSQRPFANKPGLPTVLFRQLAKDESPKTILVSGGGSGHEPAHAGYVGKGMLDVAVAGDIFASPSATQILAGIEALEAPLGVVVLVKNYTGDKLNFGLAAEKAKARGRDVRLVIVEDDASIAGNELVGRRGLAGVVFVHKISGAAAVQG